MKDVPQELIYILLFAGVLLFNFMMQRLAAKRQAELPPVIAEPEESSQDEPGQEAWGRTGAIPTAPAARALLAQSGARSGMQDIPPAGPARRFSRQALMGNRREVQNAIVIATILKPCRAFEPHDAG